MAVAQGVSTQRLPGIVGREIDGSDFLNGDTELSPGDIITARITDVDEYDL